MTAHLLVTLSSCHLVTLSPCFLVSVSPRLRVLAALAIAIAQKRRDVQVVAAGEARRDARRLGRLARRLRRRWVRRARNRLLAGGLMGVGRWCHDRRERARALDIRSGRIEAGGDQRDLDLARREVR